MQQSTVTFLLQFCMSRGGHLAEVTSAEEEELIDLVLIMGKQYWLGLNDLEEKGEFRDTNIILSIHFFHFSTDTYPMNPIGTWSWSGSGTEAGYTHWAAGQPNTGHGDEDCVFKSGERGHEGWHNLGCSHASSYMTDILALCETVDTQ